MIQTSTSIFYLELVLILGILLLGLTLLALFNVSVTRIVKDIYSKIINFIKIRKLNLIISLLFFFILFLPFSYMFNLLGIKVYLPLVSGIYACIIATVSLCINNRSNLLTFMNYLSIFTYSLFVAYIMFIINNTGVFHFYYALPLMGVGFNNENINLLKKNSIIYGKQ